MFLPTWPKLTPRRPRGARGRKPPPRPAFRPHVEALEGRCLPSTVTNLGDAGPGSLRQAILDTPAGCTVDFQPGLAGTITLTSGELLIDKDLTVAGPGADAITVSGNHASRVFDIAAPATVDISGLTVADGQSPSTESGGGGLLNAGTLTVTASSFVNNSTFVYGGGVYNTGTLSVTASTFSGNTARGEGGGIRNSSGTLVVTASTFNDNHASLGSGIFNEDGTLTVLLSTVSGNAAQAGSIYNDAGSLALTGCTINGNTGGGIRNASGTLTVWNTIVAGNVAPGAPDVGGDVVSLGHNLIGDGTGGGGYDPTDQVGTADSPVDPLLGPLQDNGGPTQTMALLCGSPAIDAGDNAGAPDFDQRGEGFPRVVGVLDPGNPVIDIGAYEVQDGECAGPAPRGPLSAQPLPAAFAPDRITSVRVPVVSTDVHPTAVSPPHAMELPTGQVTHPEGTSIARALARRDAAFAALSIEDGLMAGWL